MKRATGLDASTSRSVAVTDIRRVFEDFHFETLGIRYCNTNQRQGKAEVSGELVIMNWNRQI